MDLDAIILGAGPAGLAVAHAMQARGARVKVLEPSQRVGGSIRTIREEGWLVEVGPTDKIFTNPSHKLTEDYVTGRFG